MSKSPVLLQPSSEDYKNKETDISIILNGNQFDLHKDVLIENSEFFRAMFSSDMLESQRKKVDMKIVEVEPFEILIDGFYYGHLKLTEENVFHVAEAASILHVTSPLIDQCCNFLQTFINHDHCFEVLKFASIHPIGSVYDSARRYCLIHFLTLCQEESFFALSVEELKNYVTDKFLVADEFYEILRALKNWTSSNKKLLSDEKILEDIISACLPAEMRKDIDHLKAVTLAIINGDDFQDIKWAYLGSRNKKTNVFMFWSQLLTSGPSSKGLTDVIKLEIDNLESCQGSMQMQGSLFDSMTNVVKEPGFSLGSAVCVKGPFVYLCGGGPSFGGMNWIRDVWEFSAHKDENKRWKSIGKLQNVRRHHAMVSIDRQLYIFGGFGKFRSKNSCLESMDVDTGSWLTLSPMPEHNFAPIATSHHQSIFYFTENWIVHSYYVPSDQWTRCDFFNIPVDIPNTGVLNPKLARRQKPCFPKGLCITTTSPIDSDKQNCASSINCTVLSESDSPDDNVNGSYLQIDMSRSSEEQFCPKILKSASNSDSESESHVQIRYLDSFTMHGRVFIFLKSIPNDDDQQNSSDSEELYDKRYSSAPVEVVSFDPMSGDLKDICTLSNISRCSSIIPIPYVPRTFLKSESAGCL